MNNIAKKKPDLPVNVLDHPHWRTIIRPAAFNAERVESLGRCFEIVRDAAVRLRGWPYPKVKDERRQQGSNWVGSWTEFEGHLEYWRIHQSTQFVHLQAVREAVEPGWRARLEANTLSHLGPLRDWTKTPGFFDLTNFIWCMTEVFEFAINLCGHGLESDAIEIEVQLRGIKGFVLTTSIERSWSELREASSDQIGRRWRYDAPDLVARGRTHAVDATAWMLERLGWFDAPRKVIESEQKNLLERRW